MIEQIKQFQHDKIEVFLASGSPSILIKAIAKHLNIPFDNIIASSINRSNGNDAKYGQQHYCIGPGKEAAICRLFKKRSIRLDTVCFYTDNLSDIAFLKQVGEGNWIGSDADFNRFNLADYGINKTFGIRNGIVHQRELESNLEEYYHNHQGLIEAAITSIFPLKCQHKVLDLFIGTNYDNWDLPHHAEGFL